MSNSKNTQSRKPQQKKSFFHWEKTFPGRLIVSGTEAVDSAVCTLTLEGGERVTFSTYDLISLFNNGIFKGSVKRGLVRGMVEGEIVRIVVAKTSLQKKESFDQEDLKNGTLSAMLKVGTVEYVKEYLDALRKLTQADNVLKSHFLKGPMKTKTAPKKEAVAKVQAPKKEATGILRPLEKPKQDGKSNGSRGKSHAAPKAKPSAGTGPKNPPQSAPPQKRPSAMGTLGDVVGAQLNATKKIVADQKSVVAKPKVTVSKPNPKAKQDVSQKQEETPANETQSTTEIPEIEVVPEEKPNITARQVRMYVSTLQKNGGDLDALTVSPANLKAIRKAALETGLTLKEVPHVVH